MDYDKPTPDIKLRYVILHSFRDLKRRLKKIFSAVVYASYDVQDIKGIFEIDTISQDQGTNRKLSIVDIRIIGMPYQSVIDFEHDLTNEDDVSEVCKTKDSFKTDENEGFLGELYEVEMKVREIYTVLARLQNVSLRNSRAKVTSDFSNSDHNTRKKLVNEFFFVQFSDYKNVDKRKDAGIADLLAALRESKKPRDLSRVADELSHSTLHLEERFNELARIPEAIGRVENFRNIIAHNRHLGETEIGNFRIAKSIIEEVHAIFISRFRTQKM